MYSFLFIIIACIHGQEKQGNDLENAITVIDDLKLQSQDRLSILESDYKIGTDNNNAQLCEFNQMKQEQQNECLQRDQLSQNIKDKIASLTNKIAEYQQMQQRNIKRQIVLTSLKCQINIAYVRQLQDQLQIQSTSKEITQKFQQNERQSLIQLEEHEEKCDDQVQQSSPKLIPREKKLEQNKQNILSTTSSLDSQIPQDIKQVQVDQIRSSNSIDNYLKQVLKENDLIQIMINDEQTKLVDLFDQLSIQELSSADCQKLLSDITILIQFFQEQNKVNTNAYQSLKTQYLAEYDFFSDMARMYLKQIYTQ